MYTGLDAAGGRAGWPELPAIVHDTRRCETLSAFFRLQWRGHVACSGREIGAGEARPHHRERTMPGAAARLAMRMLVLALVLGLGVSAVGAAPPTTGVAQQETPDDQAPPPDAEP